MHRITAILLTGLFAVLAQSSRASDPTAGPPPHKQWRLVFGDEFDGNKLDESKWSRSRSSMPAFSWDGARSLLADDHADVDGKGNFVVKVTRDEDGTYRYHHGTQTKGKFQRTYGYFETRAKFSRQPGWWGAVWLYGVEVGPNPFVMGQEIDMFEDFVKPKDKLDFAHCVHIDAQLERAPGDQRRLGKLDGNTLYRFSHNRTVMVDDWDAFHVIGVEWTPLEYVFYCDGKETFRLDYTQIPVTTQPMHVLISGCFREPRKGSFIGHYDDATWPDQLTVDYVRVYEEDLGDRRKPMVSLRMSELARAVPAGQDVTIDVSAEKVGGSVKNVLLFDNGRIRGEKPAASATFTVPAGELYTGDNVLVAMARDSDGLIGISEPLTFLVRNPSGQPSMPYKDRAQAIPGRIIAGHYDEGGQGTAYGSYLKDNLFARPPWNIDFRPNEGISSPTPTGIGASHRGLWIVYTVEVKQTGDYRVIPSIARPDAMQGYSEKPDRIILEVDDAPLTEFSFAPELTTGTQYWSNYQPLSAKTVRLTEGMHVLRIRFDATPLNFGGLEFSPVADGSPVK